MSEHNYVALVKNTLNLPIDEGLLTGLRSMELLLEEPGTLPENDDDMIAEVFRLLGYERLHITRYSLVLVGLREADPDMRFCCPETTWTALFGFIADSLPEGQYAEFEEATESLNVLRARTLDTSITDEEMLNRATHRRFRLVKRDGHIQRIEPKVRLDWPGF